MSTSFSRSGDGILRLKEAITNPEPALKAIAQLLEAEVRQAFDSESSPKGRPWPALSETTLKLRKRGGIEGGSPLAGNKMLRGRSGMLMGGITAEHTKTRAAVKATGPASKYAGVHQFGNPDNKMPGGYAAPIPARPFLPVRLQGGRVVPDLSEDVLQDIRDILSRHMSGER